MQPWLQKIRLIGIADVSLGAWDAIEPRCLAALAGGLPAIMLRDRTSAADEAIAESWTRIAEAARNNGALVIVNRRLELARFVAADGIHLGKNGPTLEEARAALNQNPEAIFGYSAHTIGEAMNAFDAGFDYVTFSPIFETPGKTGVAGSIGLATLREFCKRSPKPLVALGGIDAGNIRQILETGAAGAAMIRGAFDDDARGNIVKLLNLIEEAEDIASINARKHEPTISFEQFTVELRRKGKL